MNIKNPQGTTLREFGFRDFCTWFTELKSENMEIQRRERRMIIEDKKNQTTLKHYGI